MNTRRVLFVLGGLAVLAALVVGGFLFVQNNEQLWNPYYRAALRIEAAYGDYVDITYIGPLKTSKETLAVFVLERKSFPDSDWLGYKALLTAELASLVKDETAVGYVIMMLAQDGSPQALVVVRIDAQALKAGATLEDAETGYQFIGGGTPDARYLKWMDK